MSYVVSMLACWHVDPVSPAMFAMTIQFLPLITKYYDHDPMPGEHGGQSSKLLG